MCGARPWFIAAARAKLRTGRRVTNKIVLHMRKSNNTYSRTNTHRDKSHPTPPTIKTHHFYSAIARMDFRLPAVGKWPFGYFPPGVVTWGDPGGACDIKTKIESVESANYLAESAFKNY